jgi:DNA polymerase-3 subunit epsilon
MKVLVYDTETSDLVQTKLPPSHPSQPHLVQLGLLLLDSETRLEHAVVDVLVQLPPGAAITAGAQRSHGITLQLAQQFGVSLEFAVGSFLNLRRIADVLVGHNEEYDRLVLAAALHRTKRTPSHPGPEQRFCTMRESTDIIQLPPTQKMVRAGFNKFKPPSLTEAHVHFFGTAFDKAHRAIEDCRACASVYFAIMEARGK